MEIIYKKIKEIKEYEKNPRKNNEAVNFVAESIKKFGFKVPIIIDKNNIIIAGHARYKASKKIGLKEVPCIIADDLNEQQIKAFRIADNKVAEISEWDYLLLDEELREITEINMGDFGFEISDNLGDIIQEDEFEIIIPAEPKSKIGDIYQLGNHRLMCGDSTKEEYVLKLMDKEKADMVLTDPPYNVDYEGTAGKIQNDNMKDNEFKNFLISSFTNMYKSMKNGASFYVWYSSREHVNFENSLAESGLFVRQQLIWVKNTFTLGRQDYQWRHEPCLYGWKDGASHKWANDRKQTTVLEFNKPIKNDLHPTMKPIELIGYLIENSSNKKDLVLDLFGGSGSTLIACEQLGRNCYMMELDPKYVDVIINRWESYTGKKAKLLNP